MMNDILKKIECYITKNEASRCFVLGNGPSLNNFDINILKNDMTIACNYFAEGMKEKNKIFSPTILCAGDASFLRKFINSAKNEQNYINNNIIYIFHVGSLIKNCYNITTWKTLCVHENECNCVYTKKKELDIFQEIINDNRIYLIEDFETFKLTKNLNDLMFAKQNTKQILKNFEYCRKYRNVISMISLLIAKELGISNIFLLGCDGTNFDNHFYNKQTGKSLIDIKDNKFIYYKRVYDGMKSRYDDFARNNRHIFSCNDSSYDFIPKINIDQNIFDKLNNANYSTNAEIQKKNEFVVTKQNENITNKIQNKSKFVFINSYKQLNSIDVNKLSNDDIYFYNNISIKHVKKYDASNILYYDDTLLIKEIVLNNLIMNDIMNNTKSMIVVCSRNFMRFLEKKFVFFENKNVSIFANNINDCVAVKIKEHISKNNSICANDFVKIFDKT